MGLVAVGAVEFMQQLLAAAIGHDAVYRAKGVLPSVGGGAVEPGAIADQSRERILAIGTRLVQQFLEAGAVHVHPKDGAGADGPAFFAGAIEVAALDEEPAHGMATVGSEVEVVQDGGLAAIELDAHDGAAVVVGAAAGGRAVEPRTIGDQGTQGKPAAGGDVEIEKLGELGLYGSGAEHVGAERGAKD